MSWSISEAVQWLDRHPSFESSGRFLGEPSLAAVQAVMDALGIGSKEFRTIHITGTNGKGSVARISSDILASLGHKVGAFVSPHLHRINERILINSEPVGDDLLASEMLLISGIEDRLSLTLSWFEVLTVTALSLFYAEGVEMAVVEVGIGGTWDSTNVVDADVAVITSIGHDHLDLIGPTLANVAQNKAGIVKSDSVAVVGRVAEELLAIVEGRPNSRVLALGREIVVSNVLQGLGGWRFDLRTSRTLYPELFLSLHGRHQVDNAGLAIAGVEELMGSSLDFDLVSEVLSEVSIPGRGEVLYRKPLVLGDGAHNREAAIALSHLLEDEFAGVEPKVGVIAMLGDKDAKSVIGAFVGIFSEILVCSVGDERSQPSGELADVAAALGLNAVEVPSLEEALSGAMKSVNSSGMAVVFGSFRTVARARLFLRS